MAEAKYPPSPLKVFIDASPLTSHRISGIPHFAGELIRALERHPANGKEFELILVVTFDKKKHLKKWGYQELKFKTLPIPMRLFNLLWNRFDMLFAMDLILGRGVYLFPNYRNWPISKKSYSLTFVHDMTFVRYPEFVQPKNLSFLQRNIEKWINRSNTVLAISDHARQEIIELMHIPPSKVVRVYPGVNRKEFYPRTAKQITRVRNKYNIKGEYLLYLGSLEPRKNLERLIGAYRLLPEQLREKYGLCIVGGGGWLNNNILAAIHVAQEDGMNIIKLDTYVESNDLPDLISGSMLLVHPALYEGFGLSPLQAMSCGTPVVVANNSSLPEVVGSAGKLVAAEDERDISDKIQEVLTNNELMEAMRQSGLKQAEKFTWESTAQGIVDHFDKRY